MSLFGGGGRAPAAQTPKRAMGIDLQGAQYGAPIPVVFGRNKLAGNVIDYMDFQAIAHTQKQQGGKGGGGGQTSTSYTYSVSYLLGLCEGVGSVVSVYDGSSSTTLTGVGGLAFSGASGQSAWAHLSGAHALGYSGTVLVAFQDKNLGSSASLPNYNFEIDGRNGYGGGIVDANPADIVTAICTDSQIGVQFGALGDLTAFKDYCTAAGIFFSPVYSTQNPAQQTLSDLFKYANAAPYFSEGKLKVVPYGDATITGNGVTFTPDLTAAADLTRDDFITNGPGDPVTVKRIAPADAMNIQRVEFKDRANTYHTGTVVASIDQDVVGTGARADQSDSVDMITQASVAKLVAQNLLQRTYYIRNTYEFQLSWRYCYLEPMDIVTLTDANTGLYLTPVRITDIGEDEHGLLSVTAEEFPEGISHASTYATQPGSGTSVDPNADPGPITAPYLFRGPGFLVSNAQPEIWCALSGVSALWAGCDVYLSHDGVSYTYLTTHSRRAAYGETTNSLPAGTADPDTTGAPNVVLNGPVELLGGTTADADQFITLAMIDNELIAYETATLAGGPSYTLGYLRRGGYGSANVLHAAAAPFVRLDENILRIPVDPSQIGQTVYLKFVSFNVFGKGGRTLADETAYTYVIGSNIELPDVPVTPTSPAVTGVADGNSITWYNANPAAVGCTSIEYATASGGPWTVLAQVGPTTTAYAHHFTNGATYFYRLRSRGPVVAGGWSAYTSVISATGTNVGAISTTANSAANAPAVVNPQFSNGLTSWSPGTSAGWSVQTGGSSLPDPIVNTAAVHTAGGSAASTDALRNAAHIPVVVGQQVTVTCCVNETSVNAGALGYARISWRDASNTEISTSVPSGSSQYPTCGAAGTGTYTQCVTKVIAAAPSGAQYAVAECAITGHTAGSFRFSNVCMVAQPSSVDELPDGATYARTQAFTMQNGVVVPFGNGDNLIPNHSFATNDIAAPAGSYRSAGSDLCDSWQLASLDSAYLGVIYEATNDRILVRLLTGVVVPASTTVTAVIVGKRKIPLTASETLYAEATLRRDFNQTYPASGSITIFAGLHVYDVNGNVVSNIGITADKTLGSQTVKFATITVPSNGSYAVPYLLVQHTTGATSFDTSAGLYADIRFVDLQVVRKIALETAGSGRVLGNQLNAPNSLTLNYGAVRSATALTASSTGAVSVNAFTWYMGSGAVSYSAVSNAVTGLTQGVAYYIYCHDAGGSGGAKTWYATTNINTLLQTYDDIVVAGQVTIPTSGSIGGGGTGSCVCDTMLLQQGMPAGDIQEGDEADCIDLPSSGDERFRRALIGVERSPELCVRITTDAGAVLECSESTPFDLPDGGMAYAPMMAGKKVVTDRGIETVFLVEYIGVQPVSHLHFGGCSFAAGADPAHRIYSHNQINKP